MGREKFTGEFETGHPERGRGYFLIFSDEKGIEFHREKAKGEKEMDIRVRGRVRVKGKDREAGPIILMRKGDVVIDNLTEG